MVAHERDYLIYAGRRRMGCATMGAHHLGADLRRLEQSPLCALPEFRKASLSGP